MAILLEAPHSSKAPHPCVPPRASIPPPNCKAFLLCISYLFFPDGSDPGNRPSPLAGPLNDAKEMKAVLIGGLNVDSSTAFSSFKSAAVIDLFHYSEENIFVMTDEEKNVGTEHWPSKKNIVSFFFLAECPHIHSHWQNKQIKLLAMDNLVRGATPGDAFVFFCELLRYFAFC
jgi:hypothetical protein